MPIHFHDLDVTSEMEGVSSALIVPCNLCPAVTVAVREKRPFMRFFRSLLKSAPFEEHLEGLRERLEEKGVASRVFRNTLYHQWFMCMWTSRRRRKLQKQAKKYDAVIVLGCESAAETVRKVVSSDDVKVIEGMSTSGITNAEMSVQLPGDLYFKNCTVVPLSVEKVA
jgi:hypothetical protein